MRNINFLITALLCLLLFAEKAPAQELDRKISLKVEKATLADILSKIQRDYGVRLSYLNNELPMDTIRDFQAVEEPLYQILDKLLEKGGTGYMLHGDQIIINKAFRKKAPAERKEKSEKKEEAYEAPEKPVERSEYSSEQLQEVAPQASIDHEVQEAQEENQEMRAERQELLQSTPLSVIQQPYTPAAPTVRHSISSEKEIPKEKQSQYRRKNKRSNKKQEQKKEEEQEEKPKDAPVKPLHFGLVYPISNHGTKAPLYTNRISAHLLVGVAAGLEGWEFAGLGNIEKDYVEGYQFAGLFNVVENEVKGLQFAGLLNTAGTKFSGGQFAGLFNYAGGEAKGAQTAGFMNMAKDVNGSQVAGFMNLGDTVQGTQIAGFANKARKVNGLQAAGFINLASHVKGTQIGIINISDSLEAGVPIGVFSFVRNGYKGLEIYAAEDFHANINFKTGLQKFYNIFAVGLEVGERQSWGFGYGLGSEWKMSRGFYLNTDIINYYVIEEGYRNFWNELPEGRAQVSLYKFRLLGTLQLSKRFALFAGPTYNFLLSQYKASAVNPTGSKLVQNLLYDRTTEDNNFKMWIGFNAGLRF